MKRRVLCDTNVLVSALIADGPPSRLLEEIIDGHVDFVFPELVRTELHRVLVEKLGFAPERSSAACELLARLATEQPGPPRRVDAITGDAADDAILASAAEASADVLATGDRTHLLPLGHYPGVRILTPQAVLAELLQAGAT